MTSMSMRALLCAVLLVTSALGGSAVAAVTAVGPFVGVYQETWESFPVLADPVSIMGGQATLTGGVAVYRPGVTNYNLGIGYAGVSDGVKGLGTWSRNSLVAIDFLNPVASFGAYWEMGYGFPATISFFDASDTLLDTEIITSQGQINMVTGLVDLQWHGWTSTTGIAKVTYIGECYIVNDGLQANQVPELPASVLAVIPGAMGLIWRKIKR